MVALANITETNLNTENMSERAVITARSFSRIIVGFSGSVLALVAVGLWLVPGSNWAADIMLIKLVLSLVFFGLGVALMQSAYQTEQPELHIDSEKNELRVVERGQDGVARLRQRFSYNEIASVEFVDGLMIARNHRNEPVIEVPLNCVDNLHEIRAAMQLPA